MSTTEDASKVTLKSCEKSNHKDTSKKPPFSGRETTVSGKDPLVILQINIEGWTLAKREVLENLAAGHQATVVMVQETHQTNQDRLKLAGFILTDFILSAHHGIATFVKNLLPFKTSNKSLDEEPTQWSSIELQHINIINLYYPPSAILDVSKLPVISTDTILTGDFNCRHTN